MGNGMDIGIFASSLVSSYWNGAATYYRGVVRAMHGLGHRITFYEPDAYGRQEHRDIPDPPWAKVEVYAADPAGVAGALEKSRTHDVLIKASGVGVFDQFLEKAVLECRRPGMLVGFWDVDAPATLDRVKNHADDPFGPLIPCYDIILTYGGGQNVVDAYMALGAKACVPIYNALDPDEHFPVEADERFQAELSFLGNRLPDREARVEEFFLNPAGQCPHRQFLLGGSGWGDKSLSSNVRYVGHVYTRDHNAFNCTAKAVLNINRESMARNGFSPATRIFEAAGASACIITDYWTGIEMFLEPGREVLVASNGQEVLEHLERLSMQQAREIGAAARKRVLTEHTYQQRALELQKALTGAT